MTLLTKSALSQLSDVLSGSKVEARSVDHRLVHLGIGNFHRAHQALYTDLANELGGDQWSITGVSFRSANIRNLLSAQDYIYTVNERSVGVSSFRAITCINSVLVVAEDCKAVIDEIADPKTKVVSVTVTEKGYCQKDGGLDLNNSDIAAELESSKPTTMPGVLVYGLLERMALNAGPLSVVSCDNLPHNGKILRQVVSDYAVKVSPALKAWIDENVSFSSTMVDRIVPATTKQTCDEVSTAIGLRDEAAVLCEPFKQWVVENNFCTPTPDWESAGALFTHDVEAFERLKLRVLNGCHSFLAYAGLLSGLEYIHESVSDSRIGAIIRKVMSEEIIHSLEIPSGVDAAQYAESIVARFENHFVPYKNFQVATDGSLKLPQRIISPAIDLLGSGRQPVLLMVCVAVWVSCLVPERGGSSSFNRLELVDPNMDALANLYASTEEGEFILELIRFLCPDDVLEAHVQQMADLCRVHFEAIREKGLPSYLGAVIS